MQMKYTENALQVQKLAERSANACGHSYVGSEHLLVGLVQEKGGTAGAVLREHHVEEKKAERTHREIDRTSGRSSFDGTEWVDTPCTGNFGKQFRTGTAAWE